MNNKILYLECYSGISGDMTVSSLLDLGADKEVLLKGLKSLKLDGYRIEIGRRKKCGIDGCYFDVILENHHKHIQHHTITRSHNHTNGAIREGHLHKHYFLKMSLHKLFLFL